MAETKSTEEPELDSDGLVIQKSQCRILFVLPPEGYGDQTMRYLRSSLHNIHVGTYCVSSESEAMIKGRLQDEILVDGALADVSMDEYSGLVVCGSDGESTLAADSKVQELVRAADAAGKLIAGWGNSVEVFAEAGILRRKRVTAPPEFAARVKAAGGKCTGREVQASGKLLTARDESSGMRLGQLLVETIRISEAEDRQRADDLAVSSGRLQRRALFGAVLIAGLVFLVKVTFDLFGKLHAS